MQKPKPSSARTKKKHTGKVATVGKLSRQRKPAGMSTEEWQAQLRRQFGREQSFLLKNVGTEAVFSEYAITNPQSKGRYRVAIRGIKAGENFCSCPDFATNDLGTCKHIEFTLARIEGTRGGKSSLKAGFQPVYSEIYLHYAGARSVRFRPGVECPPALLRRAGKLFLSENGWTMAADRFQELAQFQAAARETGHEVRCYDDALAYIAEVRDARRRGEVLDQAYAQGPDSPALSKLLKAKLYPYQAEGALFAVRAGRALIGDEMGLGKTIQAIAAAELFARHFGAERVLVVCPTSLKYQWQREIARFAGREAIVIRGLRASREKLYKEDSFCKITNYDTLARDLDLINDWAPDLVIVDEAQRIKNWNTLAARALKRIASPYAVVLTGTPLENRLEELISIVQFVDRYRLGPTWRLLNEHQERDEAGRVIGYRNLGHIGATLSPILLRRRKSEVLMQLPARVDNTLFVPMTSQQLKHHEENRDIVARIIKRWRKTGYLSEADQRILRCALQNMRMSCNSTYLLDGESDHGVKVDELAALLGEIFEQPDAKVVVFSQWLRSHELIIRRLEANGWGYVLFHGGVPSDKRGELVDRFHQDPDCRVFLSTDAGGVGLNLQHAAATVVNMDLPWNPAVLEQRIGRVHRLGQSRGVQVVNFVAQGTIEEGMLSILAFKKSLFEGVLDGGESNVSMQGTRLARFMKSVDEVTGAMGEAEIVAATPVTDAPNDPSQDTAQTSADGIEAPGQPAETQPTDPWAPLIDAGLKLVESLTTASASNGNKQSNGASAWIETDSVTRRSYLKLPIPEPASVQRLADALSGLLSGLRR
jgi:superfamily II DNA or RNA helicase